MGKDQKALGQTISKSVRREALSRLLQCSALLGEAASDTEAGISQWASTPGTAVNQPAKLRTLTRGAAKARAEEP